MIDFHSHIIYGVDDGAKDMQMSIYMLKEAKKAGFTDIFLTPHYLRDDYIKDKEEISPIIQKIQEKVQEEEININLYQANEIYIIDDMVDLINNGTISTINNSRYVLFELPMATESLNMKKVIYSLLENGNIPVIAHPERYVYVQKNPNRLLEWIEDGVLLQMNMGSIIGQYGKEAQKTAKKLLAANMICFLGTDTHRPNGIYRKMEQIKRELNKIIDEEQIEDLLLNNPKKVLKNEKINIEEPTEIKQSIISKLFN